jgi:UDP-3-O-[3-hydroxymyristoyl] glucosamine N-acyltransferase
MIGEGTKIDNLVQIGHNVIVGRNCSLLPSAESRVARCWATTSFSAAKWELQINLVVGEGAMIGAKSGVATSVPAGEKWLGLPAWPAREFLRASAASRRLAGEGRQ